MAGITSKCYAHSSAPGGSHGDSALGVPRPRQLHFAALAGTALPSLPIQRAYCSADPAIAGVACSSCGQKPVLIGSRVLGRPLRHERAPPAQRRRPPQRPTALERATSTLCDSSDEGGGGIRHFLWTVGVHLAAPLPRSRPTVPLGRYRPTYQLALTANSGPCRKGLHRHQKASGGA